MDKVKLHDKTFKLYIKQEEIQKSIKECAEKMNQKFKDNDSIPIIVPILNGGAFFAVDLVKHLDFLTEVDFIKATSYKGDKCSGELCNLIGLKHSVENKDVIIVDDIVDSGFTMERIVESFKALSPKSITVVVLIYKPNSVKANVKVGFNAITMLDNPFIIGYGFDYNELGRTLKDIYILED